MHVAIDIFIAVVVAIGVTLLLGVTVKGKEWDWLAAVQFSIAVCLVGLNVVLFVHHSSPTVDGLVSADLAFLVNGTFLQVVFWVSECCSFESRIWSYGTLVLGLVNDSLAIASTACAVKKGGWTSGNTFAFSLGCLSIGLPIIFLLYDLSRLEAWPRITSLRGDKGKKKHSRKPSTGSP